VIRDAARWGAPLLGTLTIVAGLSSTPAAAQPPATTVALVGGRVVDGTGGPVLERATILVVSGRVQEVGAESAVKVPQGAARIDVRGKTIIPGLINAHGHVDAARDSTVPIRDQLVSQLRMYAQYGVTTVFSLGSGPTDAQEGLKLRDEQEGSALDRARMYSAGLVVADRTAEDARKSVNRNVDQRVNVIKIRVDGEDTNPNKMTPDVYRAVIEEAHGRGVPVAAHLYYLKDARGLLDAGVDVLAHSVRDQDVPPAFIADLKRRNVVCIPTLTRELSVFAYETTPAFFGDPFFLRGKALYGAQMVQLSDPVSQEKIRTSKEAQSIKQAMQQASRNLRLLSDAGVAIAMGTDTGANLVGRWQGFFEHTELELMVKAGMTPVQTLTAATGTAARIMGLDQHIGTLRPGRWADFVVLNANPLADIRNTRQIDSVWIAGRRLPGGSPPSP